MNEVSYSAHISNGKSALNSKGRLSGVAKHNLRKYRSKEYDRENIVLLFGSTNLMRDVKKVYQDTFSEALEQYNQKQTRADRRIDDYFEHLSGKNQDMAVEIIFQCGDKDFWEDVFMETDKEKQNKENICKVYDTLLEQLQKEMPDFKVANAVVHFDEASPHMHVVGVPIGRGFKRGLETKVSKRSVFTPKTLENILQNSLRQTASVEMLIHFGVLVKDKQKGKNYDLTVAEYKVQQETKRLEMVAGFWNVQKEQAVKVSEIREEIMPENRICTLELAEVYVKAVESFMEDMEPEERTRENRPMYQRQNEEYIQGR